MPANPTFLGLVQDVQGATISIALDKDTVSGLAFIEGHGYRIGQIGSLVRIPIGFTDLFGIVSHVGAGAVPDAIAAIEPYGRRWLRVQLVGEGQRTGDFNRGISQYPTIGDEAHLVTEQDLSRIYGRPDLPSFAKIGSLASSESIPALVDLDRLIPRHSAIVGTTGAGKSTTVASLLLALSEPNKYPSARIIVFDLHGEYFTAFTDRANVFRINAEEAKGERPLFVPYWALSFDELLSVTPFESLKETDLAGITEKIKDLKSASLAATARSGVNQDTLTVDTPVPFSIHKLWYDLYRLVLSTHTAQSANQSSATEAIETDGGAPMLGDVMKVIPPKYRPITQAGQNRVYLSGAALNVRRQIVALQSLLKDTRYDFLFRPGDWCPDPDGKTKKDLDDLLKSWIGGDKPITVLDLSGVPVSILEKLVGVLIRLLFDALFWARHLPEGGRQRSGLANLNNAISGNSGYKAGPELGLAMRSF